MLQNKNKNYLFETSANCVITPESSVSAFVDWSIKMAVR